MIYLNTADVVAKRGNDKGLLGLLACHGPAMRVVGDTVSDGESIFPGKC